MGGLDDYILKKPERKEEKLHVLGYLMGCHVSTNPRGGWKRCPNQKGSAGKTTFLSSLGKEGPKKEGDIGSDARGVRNS